MYHITAVELVIDIFSMTPFTYNNGQEGTKLSHRHYVNVYGQEASSTPTHAVPTPSAVLAGLALIGISAARRQRRREP